MNRLETLVKWTFHHVGLSWECELWGLFSPSQGETSRQVVLSVLTEPQRSPQKSSTCFHMKQKNKEESMHPHYWNNPITEQHYTGTLYTTILDHNNLQSFYCSRWNAWCTWCTGGSRCDWRKQRLTPSRLENRLRQTFRLELVSLDSSQISCIFCKTGDGNPGKTNEWMSIHLHGKEEVQETVFLKKKLTLFLFPFIKKAQCVKVCMVITMLPLEL